MATLGERFKKTPLVYCAIVATILMLGYIDKIGENPIEVVPVPNQTTPIKEDVFLHNSSDGTLIHIFKINDQDMMFNINIQLLGFSNEESIALIMVDNGPYQIPYNTEKIIKDHIIKITDVDNTTQSAKIIVKRIE